MRPRVFFCEPSGLSARQRLLSDQWHERLYGLGFEVRHLRRRDYQPDPLTHLDNQMSDSHGVLVLGFSQLVAKNATWRGGSSEEQQVGTSWTSPWLQVEAGMALALGLPVLVAPETQVSEGVFASNAWSGRVQGTRLEAPDAGVIGSWAARVAGRADASPVGRRSEAAPV